jgi:hypothetical protein
MMTQHRIVEARIVNRKRVEKKECTICKKIS